MTEVDRFSMIQDMALSGIEPEEPMSIEEQKMYNDLSERMAECKEGIKSIIDKYLSYADAKE